MTPPPSPLPRRRAAAVALGLAALAAAAAPASALEGAAVSGVLSAHYRSHAGVLLNDPRATPGDVLPVTTADVCTAGYARAARVVRSSTRARVLAAYGRPAGAFELDHLVPVELGGSGKARNLWPEPAAGRGYRLKDRTEDRLHRLVCTGRLPLRTAQTSIATDWYAACLRWVTGCGLVRRPPAQTPAGGTYYADCAAVRAAGKAPLLRGQPGYRSGLDRDGDGVACE